MRSPWSSVATPMFSSVGSRLLNNSCRPWFPGTSSRSHRQHHEVDVEEWVTDEAWRRSKSFLRRCFFEDFSMEAGPYPVVVRGVRLNPLGMLWHRGTGCTHNWVSEAYYSDLYIGRFRICNAQLAWCHIPAMLKHSLDLWYHGLATTCTLAKVT